MFERAVTAVGLQCDKGVLIWDTYRIFESTVSAGDNERVLKLYKRQFNVPLRGMDMTWKEYNESLQGIFNFLTLQLNTILVC